MSDAALAPETGHVLITDDEAVVRQSLMFLFRSRGLSAQEFSGGEDLLAFAATPEAHALHPAVLLLDMRMGGIDGAETFARLQDQGLLADVPVIFLTGHGDVPMAVDALKRGAFDFVEKPFAGNALADRVIEGLKVARERRARGAAQSGVNARLESLTARERQVMELILKGKLNKQIADTLGITLRTVEVHRSRVLAKMAVRNAVELAALLPPMPAEAFRA
jgi:two-component system, LuxR family, response regulator DctR